MPQRSRLRSSCAPSGAALMSRSLRTSTRPKTQRQARGSLPSGASKGFGCSTILSARAVLLLLRVPCSAQVTDHSRNRFSRQSERLPHVALDPLQPPQPLPPAVRCPWEDDAIFGAHRTWILSTQSRDEVVIRSSVLVNVSVRDDGNPASGSTTTRSGCDGPEHD